MVDVMIQNAVAIPSSDPARAGKLDVLVLYQVGGRPTPSTIVLPEESYSEAGAHAKIRELEVRIGSSVGKTFTL
jgi:hypothetical protein